MSSSLFQVIDIKLQLGQGLRITRERLSIIKCVDVVEKQLMPSTYILKTLNTQFSVLL